MVTSPVVPSNGGRRKRVRHAAGEVEARWQPLRDRGDPTWKDILGEEPDLEFILEQLGPGKLQPASAKALAALTWGVLQTPERLSRHGWRNPGRCPLCQRPWDAAHLLFGCTAAEGPPEMADCGEPAGQAAATMLKEPSGPNCTTAPEALANERPT